MWRVSVVLVSILAGPALPAAAQTCTTNPGDIVDAAYRQVLERAPDAQASQFVQQLATGRLNVHQLVTELARSPEHRARLWEPIVEATFRQVRNAAPEREHVQAVARSIADGRQTLDDVTVAFAAEEAQAQNTDASVIAMYKRLLGRDPSAEEVAHFRERLQREGAAAVATTMVSSPEYRQRFGRNAVPAQGVSPYEQSVRSLYRHLLGRDADPEGLAALTRIATDSGFDAAIDRILTSPEYLQRYGAWGVPGTDRRLCAPTGTVGR